MHVAPPQGASYREIHPQGWIFFGLSRGVPFGLLPHRKNIIF